MVPAFLLSESAVREDGSSADFALASNERQPLLITLGITRILECESLEVSIWGSTDGTVWRPVAAFPPKCYCGKYYLPVDLSGNGDVRFLRARWKMSRWDHRDRTTLFDFYVFVEEVQARVAGAA